MKQTLMIEDNIALDFQLKLRAFHTYLNDACTLLLVFLPNLNLEEATKVIQENVGDFQVAVREYNEGVYFVDPDVRIVEVTE